VNEESIDLEETSKEIRVGLARNNNIYGNTK
jgi:hypothetical protein